MIDTVKMVAMIPFKTFETIRNNSNIKTSYNKATGEVYYEVINGSIEGTYSSNISIRVRKRRKI